VLPQTTIPIARAFYNSYANRVSEVRERLKRPLTLAEKILLSHLVSIQDQPLERNKSILQLRPDRLIMQDATAQMALLQFLTSAKKRVEIPSSVHCDHLIISQKGAAKDTEAAKITNREIYDFLLAVCQKYGLDFWGPGSGIIHQVFLESYAFPGGVVIGTDSHTPNAGGLGMAAIGVGGADAVDVMVGLPWEVLNPQLIGVHLKGSLEGWTSPKDVILKLCGILTCKGGTNRIIEYFGEGTNSISATGKATITNMGAELGATTSIFPYDSQTEQYLRMTGRGEIADAANGLQNELIADPDTEKESSQFYDQVVEIDLSSLEPHVVGPHSPDVAHPLSKFYKHVEKNGYPSEIKVALIGSCTNSSYEDIGRASRVAQEAVAKKIPLRTKLLVTPGSQSVFATAERDGLLKPLIALGAEVLANACGPCIGQWKRDDIKDGEINSILTSFNRNFPRRNDGNATTCAFIASPEVVVAMACSGTLTANPLKEGFETTDGEHVVIPPPIAKPLPQEGFHEAGYGLVQPSQDPEGITIAIDPNSKRLQMLAPFPTLDLEAFKDLPVLLKASGKCTTDHISPAGPWLRFRGHLENISQNTFSGALNAFTKKHGTGLNVLAQGTEKPLFEIAQHYKQERQHWVAIGDENYGEGSSREHAAMSPRFLNCATVIAKSFARIHETNLKKQGILPLTFNDPRDYDTIEATDRVTVIAPDQIQAGKKVQILLRKSNGHQITLRCAHSMTPDQVAWFQAGGALNLIRGNKKE